MSEIVKTHADRQVRCRQQPLEVPKDVARLERWSDPAGEHEAEIAPIRPGEQTLANLTRLVLAQQCDRRLRHRDLAARTFALGFYESDGSLDPLERLVDAQR